MVCITFDLSKIRQYRVPMFQYIIYVAFYGDRDVAMGHSTFFTILGKDLAKKKDYLIL